MPPTDLTNPIGERFGELIETVARGHEEAQVEGMHIITDVLDLRLAQLSERLDNLTNQLDRIAISLERLAGAAERSEGR